MKIHTATLISCLGIFAFGFGSGRQSTSDVRRYAAATLGICYDKVSDARIAMAAVDASLKFRIAWARMMSPPVAGRLVQ